VTAPTLITLHPGAFALGDPSFEDQTVALAESLGFTCVNLDYPLCNPQRALNYCVAAAAAAASGGSSVYVYGDSAGAALACRLVQVKRAVAGVAYSPPMRWASYVRAHAKNAWAKCLLPYTDAQLDTVSPILYPTVRPLVVMVGSSDCVIPPAETLSWAATESWIWSWRLAGGHLGDTSCLAGNGGPGNTTYDAANLRAIKWLAGQAGLA
jgi:acetyl esterase/lipase